MISASQIRAARALLHISAAELSERCGVDLRTIQRFERQDGIPPSRSGTLGKVEEALRNSGVDFLGDPLSSPGVQIKRTYGA